MGFVTAADITSWISAGTSLVSIGLAGVAYRRSGPRVRVDPNPGFFLRSGKVSGSTLRVFVNINNTGDRAVRVNSAILASLVPRERMGERMQIPVEGTWSRILLGGRPAHHVVVGGLRPLRFPFRRSRRWLEFGAGLSLPHKKVLPPFDGLAFDAEVPWGLIEVAAWLRFEVHLASGEVMHSSWWRYTDGVREEVELYKHFAEGRPGLAGALRRSLGGAKRRRAAGEETPTGAGHEPEQRGPASLSP